VMFRQQAMLVTYDTTDEDDAKLGVQLGCNGIIHILIEPLFSDNENFPIALFKQFLSKREPVVLVTMFSLADRQALQPGTCLLMKADETTRGSIIDKEIKDAVLVDAVDVLKNGNSVTKTYVYGNGYTCFIELLQPAVSLVIFGAGNDAIPMTQFASVLGWQITLVDGRANYAVPERFPQIKNIIIAKPDNALANIVLDERTVMVLMTHNYNYDMAMLRQCLPLKLPYVASLGPKKRLLRMLDELRQEGMTITGDQLQSLFGPAGIDIGSENSDEIALSIVAEIQAVLNNRAVNSLRDKTAVHDRHIKPVLQQTATAATEKSK